MPNYTVSVSNNEYTLNTTSQAINLSLARTGGQGSKGDSITDAYLDGNNDFIVEISNSAGVVVQTLNIGGGTIAGNLAAFDTIYLGAKASEPTTDNSGDSLVDGALFFNTTTNEIGVFDLGASTWEYPTLEATTSATNASASAALATTKASDSATSATDAASSASAAFTSATNAATSETNASAHEAQASSQAASAATSLASVQTLFDNFYSDFSASDPILTIHDANTSTPAGDAGLEVYRGGTEESQRLIWNETDDKWEFKDTAGTPNYATVKAAAFEGPLSGTITGDVTGDVYANNGTSKVLENGTDGTDATFTGDVTGQVSDISNHSTTNLSEGTNLYHTDARARAAVSVTDAGGDGSLSYNSGTGVVTYTGPSAAEVRAHITAGTGVSISSGQVSIGQAVATSDDVTFNKVTTSLIEGGSVLTIDPATTGDATGEVIIAGSLTVQGTTTSINSNEVNIGDSIILLNSDETGTPSQNGGIEIERGTAANKSFLWNEAAAAWDLSNEELQNVTLDGGTY